jgi:hypothetical protein
MAIMVRALNLPQAVGFNAELRNVLTHAFFIRDSILERESVCVHVCMCVCVHEWVYVYFSVRM